MRIPRLPHRPRRLLAVCAAAAVAGAVVAGCGSGASPAVPQGLSGSVAGVPGNSQYAAENAAAATVLTPAAARSWPGEPR